MNDRRERNQNVLIVFMFETGDCSVPFYNVPVTVYSSGDTINVQSIVECSAKFASEHVNDDIDYEDIVNGIMSMTDYVYEMYAIRQCDHGMRMIYM